MKTAVGIDLGGTFIKYGLVGDDGAIIARRRRETGAEHGRDEIIRRLKAAVAEMLAAAGNTPAGIGIATPGLVDAAGAVFLSPNLPDWDNLPLARIFRDEFSLPVTVENDVNALTWGELVFGAGRPFRSIVCITLGTGLGGGVVLDGRLLRGGRYSALEIGHTTINARGLRCKCGGIGCVERYVGAAAIVARAKRRLKKSGPSLITALAGGDPAAVTPEIIGRAAARGDRLAREIWEDVGTDVGALLADMVNLFNPEAIIVGGGVARAGRPLFEAIEKTIAARAFPILSRGVLVRPASLGGDSGIMAAAALNFQSAAPAAPGGKTARTT